MPIIHVSTPTPITAKRMVLSFHVSPRSELREHIIPQTPQRGIFGFAASLSLWLEDGAIPLGVKGQSF